MVQILQIVNVHCFLSDKIIIKKNDLYSVRRSCVSGLVITIGFVFASVNTLKS